MVSGLLLGSMGSDVFALSDKGAENDKAKGCANDEVKNNHHCGQDQCDSNLTYYFDGDGYGTGFSCEQLGNNTDGYVSNHTDCDDGLVTVNPEAPEITCNGVDKNCNGSLED